MNHSDYLPRKDADFLQWTVNFLAVLLKIFERISFPKAVYQQLVALKTAFDEKLRIAEAPETRTKPAIRDKNDARKSLEKDLRKAIGEYLTNNHQVTDADRDSLGIPVHKTTHTPVHEPTTFPEAEVKLPSPGVVEIHFRDAESKRKAKPKGIHGAEIAWAILPAPTVDWRELNHSTFDTHTPQRLTFDGTERGKTVYFALRWENTRGEKGPWSEIMSAIIP
jgi:hypothetical protein